MIVFYIILVLIAVLLIAAFLLPKNYNVEKSTIINKPRAEVTDMVGNLNYYSQWNPWQQADPTTKYTVTGLQKTPGHKYAWTGKKTGVGELRLIGIDEKHIHFELNFFKPFKSKAKDNWLFEKWGDGNETKVTWQNSGELPFPIARLMGPVINRNLNQQFVTGLSNLKKMCEV